MVSSQAEMRMAMKGTANAKSMDNIPSLKAR